jgi:hypothetical protein
LKLFYMWASVYAIIKQYVYIQTIPAMSK